MDVEEEQIEKTTPKKQSKKPTALDNFAKLTSEDARARARGGVHIIKHLTANPEGEDELKRTLVRLVRGTGSTRNSTRAGYYSALTVLLQNGIVDCDVDDVLEAVRVELSTSGNNSKSENADILTGHILACGAIVRSKRFNEAEPETQKKVVETLLHAGKKRSYLSLPAYSFVVDCFETMDSKGFQQAILPIVKPEITKALEDFTLDNLYFLLAAEERFPDVVNGRFLNETIKEKKLLTENTVSDMARVLMGVLPLKQIEKHPAYAATCKRIANTKHLKSFLAAIDEGLAPPTHVRHLAASTVMTKLVEFAEEKSIIPEVFTPNFVQVTLRHFRQITPKMQDDVKDAVLKLLETVIRIFKGEGVSSDVKVATMEKLMFYPGTFIFEKLTGTKILQQITMQLDSDGVKKLCSMYEQVLLAKSSKHRGETETASWSNADRVYAAHLIVKLLGHPLMKTELEWRVGQIKLLADVGLLKNADEGNVGVELASSIKETFFRALDIKLPKLEDLRKTLSVLVHHLDKHISEETFATALRVKLSYEAYATWKRTVEMIEKLEQKTKKSHLNPVFHVLFLHMALQLFNEPKLAADSLEELFSCYTHVKEEKKARKHNESIGGGAVDDEIKWIEVVVDLFLSLLSRNSHLLRSLVGCVFPHLCKHLTLTAVHHVLSVLDPKNDANPLSEDISDSESEAGESEDDEESASEEDSGNESLEEVDTVSDKLKQAVREALGANSDDESVDMDQMDEEECEKLNVALGNAFRQFKPANESRQKRKKQSKEEQTLTHFRSRVLDLINIYLDSPDVSMLVCLEVMVPLLQTLEFAIKDPHQKPLQDRVRATLKKLVGLKKFASVAEVTEVTLLELLQSLLEKDTKTALMMQEMGATIADCSVFIIKCAQNLCTVENTPKKTRKRVKKRLPELLIDEMENFFVKRDCLTPYVLFKNLVKIDWASSIQLIGKLEQFAFAENVRPFRRCQALELLKLFYTNHRVLTNNKDEFKPQLEAVEASLGNNALQVLQGGQTNVKEKFVCAMFQVLTAVKNSPIQNDSIDWDKIASAAREFRSGTALSADAKQAFCALCRSLKVSHVVKMKPTAAKLGNIVDNESVGSETGEKRKRKKNREGRKLKKEARELRLQSLSHGFGDDLPFTNGFHEEEEDVRDEKTEKRKKKHEGSSSKKKARTE